MFDDTDYSLDPEAVSNLKEAGGTEDQPEALQRIRKKILDDLEIVTTIGSSTPTSGSACLANTTTRGS